MNPSDVTAVILTRDEERDLPRAITSLPYGMPLLVLDAYSADDTVLYARGAGATVIERAWTNFVDARRYALEQVRTPWTMMLDADEALDDRLRDALLAADESVDGYIVRRDTYFRGKPMRMWRGEPLLRIVKTERARIEPRPASGGDAALHERLVCDGPTATLDGVLLHFSYPDAQSYREKFASYTSIEAQSLHANQAAVFRQFALVLPRFANYLLRRGAIMDGTRGWYIAWYSALYPFVCAWKSATR